MLLDSGLILSLLSSMILRFQPHFLVIKSVWIGIARRGNVRVSIMNLSILLGKYPMACRLQPDTAQLSDFGVQAGDQIAAWKQLQTMQSHCGNSFWPDVPDESMI